MWILAKALTYIIFPPLLHGVTVKINWENSYKVSRAQLLPGQRYSVLLWVLFLRKPISKLSEALSLKLKINIPQRLPFFGLIRVRYLDKGTFPLLYKLLRNHQTDSLGGINRDFCLWEIPGKFCEADNLPQRVNCEVGKPQVGPWPSSLATNVSWRNDKWCRKLYNWFI